MQLVRQRPRREPKLVKGRRDEKEDVIGNVLLSLAQVTNVAEGTEKKVDKEVVAMTEVVRTLVPDGRPSTKGAWIIVALKVISMARPAMENPVMEAQYSLQLTNLLMGCHL
jgi:hypothetical protein